MFPIGVPGMGKTHFAENVLKRAFASQSSSESLLHVISNDSARENCIEEWRKANPRKSVSDGLKATATKSINLFKDQLNDSIRNLSSSQSDQMKMIYLDKNYPPREIKLTLEAIA
mmetsp:Transcript_33045/g.40920  ORF Transcript_33045/g.40920 Transcript_33045/m.40920 type:complete len:115 (+) Transcript_33045:2658-3002(+)